MREGKGGKEKQEHSRITYRTLHLPRKMPLRIPLEHPQRVDEVAVLWGKVSNLILKGNETKERGTHPPPHNLLHTQHPPSPPVLLHAHAFRADDLRLR